MAKTKSAPKRRRIRFTYRNEKAEKVFLAGDFNQWDPKSHPMKKNADGIWMRSVLVTPGRYEYKFFVDGSWKEDTLNPKRCSNMFGTYNCVVDIR